MMELENISHVYKGLINRSRAFASFKEKDELDVILEDLSKHIAKGDCVFDPMSGYGGGMRYFGRHGYKTTNIELNPPSYYWQVLKNPTNTDKIIHHIDNLKEYFKDLPKFKQAISISDSLFSDEAVEFLSVLYGKILNIFNYDKEIAIAVLLPFVSRFANYQRSSTNITHFKEGGLCSYIGWEIDFFTYLDSLKRMLAEEYTQYSEISHVNILSDIMLFDTTPKYSCFVTSPPYPNYRDYSKLFKIENWVLNNIINSNPTNFTMMIGSNNVSGKFYGDIESESAQRFLSELIIKSKKLQKKSRYDIEVYYHPYFCQYFYNIQEAYKKIDKMLTNNALGYIVVNDNITRDIPIPVGASICDIFKGLGYQTEDYNISHISHYGNIGRMAKRINSHHLRHILKVWK